MIWRWDQGRGAYFKFEAIKKMSVVLLDYNGADMQVVDSRFRDDLMEKVGLPFAPPRYTIKRNYKRVFECAQLATYINNRLIVSDICRALANDDPVLSTPDGYLGEVEKRFRYPYPAFNNYSDEKNICFPFLAIQKFLLAKSMREENTETKISLDDIGTFLIANEVSGLEKLDYYWKLTPKKFSFESYSSNDQRRQVREMMSFIGQHNYLQYENNNLSITGVKIEDYERIFNNLRPIEIEITSRNPVDDFMRLTKYATALSSLSKTQGENEDDTALQDFTVSEGRKVFASHFTRERNSALRREYIKQNPKPVCDVCGRDMHISYPWTQNMLEIHHLLPLSSAEDKTGQTTLIRDVIGICPSCHRAIHLYYKKYLTENRKQDFDTDEEAISVYNQAKSEVNI